MVIGSRIQELRRAAGETQETVAERVNMLTPNYARLEQGRVNPTVETLLRVADALGVELAELFVPTEKRPTRPGRPRKP